MLELCDTLKKDQSEWSNEDIKSRVLEEWTPLIIGIPFYWSTLYPNPIAQKIKRQMDFRDALLRSFQQSHPNFKDCNWQGPDIVCKSE